MVSEFEKGCSKSLECESSHKLFILSISFSQDCDLWQTYIENVPENVDFEENDDNCFGTNDLEKLQQIINLNQSLEGSFPLEIGNQIWEDHRITYLNLYSVGLDTIPETISEMTKLTYLSLSVNLIVLLVFSTAS